jgi:hypothetical protein
MTGPDPKTDSISEEHRVGCASSSPYAVRRVFFSHRRNEVCQL